MLFLSVDLGVKRFNLTIRDAVQILAIFHNIKFFLKKLLLFFFFFINIVFAVFNVLFVEYSLPKNNLNNTYQYNMISKKKILRQ
jgi:hypothetical protein